MIIRLLLTSVLFAFSTLASFGQNNENDCKCCSDKHRQFDFWLGEWDVYANDKMAGSNSITIRQDSCLIREEWMSSGGAFTGTSYNFYNKQKNRWQQLWIDNQGGILELYGDLQEDKMVLSSEVMTDQKGNKSINRITWTPNPDGTVRQLWQSSTDMGKSWNTVFDGLYKRKGTR